MPSIPIKRPGRPICQRMEGTTKEGCLALVFGVIASQNVANGRERLVLGALVIISALFFLFLFVWLEFFFSPVSLSS